MRVEWLENASSGMTYHETAKGEYRCGVFAKRMSIAVAFVVLAAGCGTTAPGTPASTADAYMDALRRGDGVAARYLLVSSGSGPEASELEQAKVSPPGEVRELERIASWAGSSGSPVTLVLAPSRRNSGWLIRSGVLESFSALSPEACLDLFAQALWNRDPRLLKTLLPTDLDAKLRLRELEAALLRPKWSALAAALRAGALRWVSRGAERVEVEVVVEGETHTLALVREGLVWKVFDVRPWKGYLPP